MLQSMEITHRKIYLIGMLCAGLAWGMACVDLGTNTYFWFSGLAEEAYRQGWSDHAPRLISEGFTLSWGTKALLVVLDYLSLLCTSISLLLTGLFFMRLAKGERWTQRNSRTLIAIGLVSILSLLLQPFIDMLVGLVLSIDLPKGERVIAISLGVTSYGAYEFLKGVFVCAFGLVMNEARKLDEEVKAFI